MHRHGVHAAARLAEQAQLPVRAGARVRPAPEQPFLARQAVTVRARRGELAFDGDAPGIGQVFVRIQQQDPVAGRELDRRLLLRTIAGKGLGFDARAMPARDLEGGIGRARIQQHDLVAEPQAGQAGLQRRRVVQRGDDRGKPRLHVDSRPSRLPAYSAASSNSTPPQKVEYTARWVLKGNTVTASASIAGRAASRAAASA